MYKIITYLEETKSTKIKNINLIFIYLTSITHGITKEPLGDLNKNKNNIVARKKDNH